MDYFIVRDANSHGDVATVWNWRLREWAWDVDGEYTFEDGFAYTRVSCARHRLAEIEAYQPRVWPVEKRHRNIRVVTRPMLDFIRSE
jgi:hypothetical protein